MTSTSVRRFLDDLVNSIFELFVEPEITRRGLALERDEVRKVVVELNPDQPHPVVRLNDQAKILAEVRVTRDIAEGDVTAADIAGVYSVEPEGIGPNSGCLLQAVINGHQCIKFDFRYNKERVLAIRARQFFRYSRGLPRDLGPRWHAIWRSPQPNSPSKLKCSSSNNGRKVINGRSGLIHGPELDNAPPSYARDALCRLLRLSPPGSMSRQVLQWC